MTTISYYVMLDERGVLAIEGEDARGFLQGLISNDMEKVSPEQAIYAALLTPQGKFLFDFMIAQEGGQFLLDAEAERLPALQQRLTMYKLRAKVDIANVSEDFSVAALLGPKIRNELGDLDLPSGLGGACRVNGGVVFADPRYRKLGARAILPKTSMIRFLDALGHPDASPDAYDRCRCAFAIPEGSADFGIDKSTLMECGFEDLNGVDFKKGCFIGQELTARMKYRGLLRKRVIPAIYEGDSMPVSGTVIKANERDVGEVRSATDKYGFAMFRLDKLKESFQRGDKLLAGDVTVQPIVPSSLDF